MRPQVETNYSQMNKHQSDPRQELLTEAHQLLHLDCESIRRERFIKGVFCPHCMQETGKMVCSYVRFGLVNGTHWQRYRCRQCKRVFSDLTRTLFHRSRNIQKWPLFIQYVMVEKLPAKQIAAKLELHINTIYTWNKKLSAFFALYLPNKQFQQSDQSSHDSATITVSLTDKGNTLRQKSQFPESSDDAESNSTVTIPVTIAVNRENPSHILFTIHQDTGSNVALKAAPSQTEALTKVIQEFRAYNSKKRGIAFRNLFMHLTFFRMLKLMEAINPVIMPYELFKLCLDKDRLSRSNRLLKRLI